jgi:hypothetical protein
MPDICDLILDDHELFRRRFAELDDERNSGGSAVVKLWEPLAEHLERHAAAEEAVFYPAVLNRLVQGTADTHHALRDHNKIRAAVRDVAGAEPGTDGWWAALKHANDENSDHMAEEERGPLSDFRQQEADDLRKDLGSQFVAFNSDHAGGRDLDTSDTDPEEFLEAHADE